MPLRHLTSAPRTTEMEGIAQFIRQSETLLTFTMSNSTTKAIINMIPMILFSFNQEATFLALPLKKSTKSTEFH